MEELIAFGGKEGDVFFVLRDDEEVGREEVGGGGVRRGSVHFLFLGGERGVSSRDDGRSGDVGSVLGFVAKPGPGWRLESDGVGSRASGDV